MVLDIAMAWCSLWYSFIALSLKGILIEMVPGGWSHLFLCCSLPYSSHFSLEGPAFLLGTSTLHFFLPLHLSRS